VAALLCEHACASGRTLDAAAPAALSLETDRALLGRVLVNMARNALEATPPGGTVRLRSEEEPESGALRFSVENPGAMPAAVQARVFQRSFSTKGRGRGLGTYGMKLIGERYLCGAVWFDSGPETTTFSIRVPPRLPDAAR
jgi:signal transduction histidine kinase